MDKIADSRAITRIYFDSLLLEQRLLGSTYPNTETVIFGSRFSTPIMTAALSHLNVFYPDAEKPMEAYAKGAAQVSALHWIGMSSIDEFQSVIDSGAKTVRIIKPFANRDKIIQQIQEAESSGALAVGIDIDHTFSTFGDTDTCQNEPMAIYSLKEWRAIICQSKLPFVMKGILSVQDALMCQEIGVAGIVVSHHNGRLPSAVPPLLILPDIRKSVGPDYPIFVDCGISSGIDAYKALALGANAVSVGRHLIPYLIQKGTSGVACRIQEMTAELRGIMAKTGVKDTSSFDATVLHLRTF